MKNIFLIFIVLGGLFGCDDAKPMPHTLELTYNRGAQLLAAGSPKSAIPYLTQTVTSEPDGPEPVALLSLALALDLQSEQALMQAKKVHRPIGEGPGWEGVAVGIAESVRHHPDVAIDSLNRVLESAPANSAMVPATLQWLVLAEVLKGDHAAALVSLDQLAKYPPMTCTALLWSVLIHSRDGQTVEAANALKACATEISAGLGAAKGDGTPDDQTLYDAGIEAIAAGKLDRATELFTELQARDTNSGDAGLWLALLAGAQGHWQDGNNTIVQASETGPVPSRGLANQLCTVIRALEDRPESMIDHMLEGQRLMDRGNLAQVVDQPQPDKVWFSDSVK